MRLRESCLEYLLAWEPRQRVRSESERWTSFFSAANTEDRQRFLICERTDGRIVGYVGLNDIRRGVMQSCTTGYWIAQQFANRGYMTEGLFLALRFAFGRLDLHRVEAGVQPHNTPSLAVVRKLGFRHEGTALRLLEIDGRWRDHERWALTREEFDPAQLGRVRPLTPEPSPPPPPKPAPRAKIARRSRAADA